MDIKETLATKKVETKAAVYKGDYRILGTNAIPIPKTADVYNPQNEDHIKVLEEMVARGFITKG